MNDDSLDLWIREKKREAAANLANETEEQKASREANLARLAKEKKLAEMRKIDRLAREEKEPIAKEPEMPAQMAHVSMLEISCEVLALGTLAALVFFAVGNGESKAIAVALFGFPAVFVILHLRQLRPREVHRLAEKRRRKQVRAYFWFSSGKVNPNAGFKNAMAARGAFYPVEAGLSWFPSFAAALLKHKKHEWIIIAFERAKKVDLMWLNKGSDRTCVAPHLSMGAIVQRAQAKCCASVLVFHNHPNPDPSRFDMLCASAQDHHRAALLRDVALPAGVNLLEFVCERGRFLEYHRSVAPAFFPLEVFTDSAAAENGRSSLHNLRLHLERLFTG